MIDISIEDRNDVVIVKIKGEFHLDNIQKVEDIWQEQMAKKPKVIGIDCRELEFIDSSAIGTLVKFLNSAMGKKIKLVFYDLSITIQQIFKTARLNNFFTITEKKKFENEYLLK